MLHGWVGGEWSRRARACAGSVARAGAEGGDSWKKRQLPGSRGCQMQEAGAGTGLFVCLFVFFLSEAVMSETITEISGLRNMYFASELTVLILVNNVCYTNSA